MRRVLLWAWLCAALAMLAAVRGSLHGSGGHVVELDPANFEREVARSDAVWLVEFYAPCHDAPHDCQRPAPEWRRAAAALRGVAKLGAVDGERHEALAVRYGVRSFPAIKVFGGGGADKGLLRPPEDYRGGRGSREIADAALGAVRALVEDRLAASGGKSGGSKGSTGGSKGSGSKGGAGGSGRSSASSNSGKNSDVVELTDANFDRLVLQGGGSGDGVDAWMVGFFAPWCGHCQRLEPEWAAAATAARERTGGRVRLGAVDATVHQALAGRYDIGGFPTIKIFRRRDAGGPPEDYRGGRSRGEIAAKAAELFAEAPPPPPPEPLAEILGEDVFRRACDERQLCVVAVLPHVLDSGAAGRNAYLELVRRMAAKSSSAPWGWLWAEAGAQPGLEEALGVQGLGGYPVMAAVNTRRARAAVLRGSFGESAIGEFLGELRSVAAAAGRGGSKAGSAHAAVVAGFTMPKIHQVQAWDGKDGQPPLVEEYDLSNVEL